MRRFSSTTRYAYKRLLEGTAEKEIEKTIQEKHKLNARYVKDAVLIAKGMLKSCVERGQNPKKLVFGSRELFEKLKKKHITGIHREKLRQRWEERRYYYLYSRGEKSKNGNLNLRFVWEDSLWFAYNVRLKVRNGKFYAQVSWEEKSIDINAYPFHLALAYVSTDGNLEKFERIDLREMEGKTKNQREHIAWHIARQVVERALEGGKAIVVEDLQKVPKGRRGDGLAKLRRKLHKWVYKSVLEKIEVYARRVGVQVIKVNPAYTSIIGKLKYSPMLGIDKDVASAYVIGRRGLGFEEKLPKNYRELLKDKEFLSCAIAKVDERINKLKSELEKEKNDYKKNALKGRIKRLRKYLKLLLSYTRDSGKSEPASQEPVNRKMERVRGPTHVGQKSWRVLSVALASLLATTCLEWCRDHSPLKRVLTSGDWVSVAGKGSPSLPGQGTAASNCSFIYFG
jgi:IS605 OrfB family transposase